MRVLIPALAISAALALPAAAETMTCGQFAALSDGQKIEAVERIEPKSVEENDVATKIDNPDVKASASSGPAGTVDPNLTEAEKVAALDEACFEKPDLSVEQAMANAFK